jgi:7,8-dihydropterin-6-yl-methyl-4-(beta-D-ribofuranosyl)aminobenzene 5'-phosphate synthase
MPIRRESLAFFPAAFPAAFWAAVWAPLLAAFLVDRPAFAAGQVRSLEVRILSTMLTADDGIGEWGFSALVVADGHRILVDTGAYPDTVLRNCRELKIDLSGVPDVILTHNHNDHTGGFLALRKEYAKVDSSALSRAHVASGIFLTRVRNDGREINRMAGLKREYEATGAVVIEYSEPKELFPGVWLTGPVPRKYPERNWSGTGRLRTADGKIVEDNVPEDQSLVIDTDRGLVVITGCGHAGIVNICEYSRSTIRKAPVYAVLGGIHLYEASDETLDWTGAKLKEFGLQNLLGAHCTGIEAVYRLRALTGLVRKTAAVGAVGGGFSLANGLDPGSISR